MIIQAYELGTTRAASLLSCSFTNETPGTTSSTKFYSEAENGFSREARTFHHVQCALSSEGIVRCNLGAVSPEIF